MTARLDRRDFLRSAAAGSLVLAVGASGCRRADPAAAVPTDEMAPHAYIRVDDTGTVTIVVHRSEMGQGVRTGMAMAIADELEADWARVKVEQADSDEAKYGSQNTDGSTSIRNFLPKYREAGATVRTLLERAAAAEWQVPPTEVEARLHTVVHVKSGRALPYGKLVTKAKALPLPAAGELVLKPKEKFRYIGKVMPSVDLVAMTTGRGIYGQDVRRPGMKYAVIARPPVYGGRVATLDAAAAERVAGVEKVLQLPAPELPAGFSPLGGVAVVAANTWAAMQGRQALAITWNDGPNADYDSTAYRALLAASVAKPGTVSRTQGDVAQALRGAARTIEAEYYLPHLAHAQMEPPAAVADVREGAVEIWACTQDPQAARATVAKTLGIPVEQVTLHITLLGGAFGRKSKPDFIVEAAWLSRELKAPVKVVWTREDDIRHDYHHTVTAARVAGGLDASGRIVAWHHRSALPSIGALFAPNVDRAGPFEDGMGLTDFPYDVPAYRAESGRAPAHARVGWFRSVINIPHAFVIGSFLDELAHAAGQDPRAFLLNALGGDRTLDPKALGLTGDPWNYGESFEKHPIDTARIRGVVERVTQEAGWGTPLPPGEGRGLAVHRSFLTYVACVVHAKVGPDGTLTLPRVDIAMDAGLVVHPERAHSQMEGAVIMGLSNALYGEVTFAKGRVVQGNYNDYRIMRLDASPRTLRTHLVGGDHLPGGVGEPGLPPVAPALANAIFAATGKRLRTLPLESALKAAMASA